MSSLEHKLLSCLQDPSEIAKVWGLGLKPEVFEEPLTRAAYDFTIAYWLENQMEMAPTSFVIEHELPGFKLETEVEESVIWLAEQLQRRYAKNQLQEMLRDAASSSHEDPIDTLRQLHSAAYDAAEAVAPRVTRVNMADNIDERRRRYTLSENQDGQGVPLGIPQLDEHIGWLRPGELAAVGGYAKTGKTFFLVNAAVAALKAGHTPIIFTLEMGLGEIEDRIDCMFSEVSYNRFTNKKLGFDEVRKLHAGQDRLREIGGILVESPEEGDRTVASLINRARHVGSDFAIIDQLSHMEAGKRTRDLKEHHGTIMKQFSTELSRPGREIPCLLSVQLNRQSLDQNEPMGMQHFANAAEIEREADLLLGLSRNSEERRNRVMKMEILGARRSDNKTWMLNWNLVDKSEISVLDEVR